MRATFQDREAREARRREWVTGSTSESYPTPVEMRTKPMVAIIEADTVPTRSTFEASTTPKWRIFRVTSGERLFEKHQSWQSACRVVARENRFSPLLTGASSAYARMARIASNTIALLQKDNERLKQEVSFLRGVVLKKPTPNQSTIGKQNDALNKASQLLATLSDIEAELALRLFENGELSINDVTKALDPVGTHHFANALGWSETGFVDGAAFRSTKLGTAVADAISAAMASSSSETGAE